MIRILTGFACVVLLSCNSNEGTGTNPTSGPADSPGSTHPTAIDTTKHADGVTNGSVISTDTAAFNGTTKE